MPPQFSASLVESKTSPRIIKESWPEPLPLLNRFKLKDAVFLHCNLNYVDKFFSLTPMLFYEKNEIQPLLHWKLATSEMKVNLKDFLKQHLQYEV